MRIGLLVGTTLYPLAGQAGVAESVHSSAAGIRIGEEIQQQTSARVRGAFARHWDRGNLAAEIEFETTRTFATTELAENWAQDYSGIMPRAGTLVLDTSERNGHASQIAVAGALTSNGVTAVTLGTLPYDSTVLSRPKFKNAGLDTAVWSGTYWALTDNATGAQWRSADGVSSPELCTTWTPQGAATGTPVIAATYPGRRYLTNAIVHPPARRVAGCSVLLSYRVSGAAFVDTVAEIAAAWDELITWPGDNWED